MVVLSFSFLKFGSFFLDGPETTEIIIFAELNSTTESHNNVVQLSVARLTHRPVSQQVQKRVPRPDDPTPRKPPVFFLEELKRTGSTRELKRVASGSIIGVGKRQKLSRNGTGIAADLGSGVRLGGEDDRVFKVPEVPRQTKGKEKEDVFGDIAEVNRVGGKGKQRSEEGHTMVNEVAFEKANKNVSISYDTPWI